MVFFYRRFLPLDVYKYAFGAENDASYSNLPIPLVKPKEAVSNFAFETASHILACKFLFGYVVDKCFQTL